MGNSTILKTYRNIPIAIFQDWGLFSIASLTNIVESAIGLSLIASNLTDIEFAEWAVLSTLITVGGSISQWGFKTGYMQMVIGESSRVRQLQNLRSGTFFLIIFGCGVGLVIAALLGTLSHYGQWSSMSPLFVIPLLMAINNGHVLLVSDLRITRKVHQLTLLTVIRVPIYLICISCLLAFETNGLLAIYLSSCISAAIALFYLKKIVGVRFNFYFRRSYLTYAFQLGTPIMLSLLLRYANDAIISAGIRWGFPEILAAEYGRSLRLMEIFNALFWSSLIMAWGPNFFLIIKQSFLRLQLKKISYQGLLLCLIGIPIGYTYALVIPNLIDGVEIPINSLILFAVTSRMASFAALSPSQYGVMYTGQYKITTWLSAIELLTTSVIWLSAIHYKNLNLALWSIITIPWFLIVTQYFISANLLKQSLHQSNNSST